MQSENQKIVPDQIRKWNWGAFSLNVIWGICNKTYLPLLCLVPFVNIVMVFICGIYGNEWAWKNGCYKSVDEFSRVQKTWNRVGLVFFFIVLELILFALLALLLSWISSKFCEVVRAFNQMG